MRRPGRTALLLALSLAPSLGAAAPAAARVAVMAAAGGSATGAAAARAATEAARQDGADAIPPDEVARAIAAAKAEPASCAADPACVVATCAALRAEALLAVSVAEVGTTWRLELRLLDGKRGRVRGQAVQTVAREVRLVREASARLATGLVERVLYPDALPLPGSLSPPLAAAPPSPAAPLPPPPRLAAEAPRPLPPTALAAAPAPAPSARGRWGAVLAGTGAALIASGAVTGALAWSASGDATVAFATGNVAGFASRRGSARQLGWAAAALGGAGAAALASGAWVGLGGPSHPVAVGIDGAGARVAVAF